MMDEATIRELWEKYPCGDVLVGRLDDEYAGNYRRFFDEYDAFRYAMEDHIPRCLDEGDWAGKKVLGATQKGVALNVWDFSVGHSMASTGKIEKRSSASQT